MRRYLRWIFLTYLTTVVLTGAAAASSSGDSTAPTTAAVVPDSPKAALKAYNAAMRAGDVAGMVSLQHATNEDESRIARACAQSDLEIGKLIKAARDKFGSDAAKQVATAVNDEGDDDIAAAAETINGNHGGVTFAGGGAPSPLIRVQDAWKVDVAAMLKDLSGTADQLADSVIRRGSVAKVTAQELLAGHYHDTDALLAALKNRLKDE